MIDAVLMLELIIIKMGVSRCIANSCADAPVVSLVLSACSLFSRRTGQRKAR